VAVATKRSSEAFEELRSVQPLACRSPCLHDIEDGTRTLIMEHPPVNDVSFSIDEAHDRAIEHLPLEVRVKHLLQPWAPLIETEKTS
jgi:hypothetical protein